MKVNFKVKMKVTIEFLVEIYFRNDFHFFEKYFTWGNIQPSRDFLDTLYKRRLKDYVRIDLIRTKIIAENTSIARIYELSEMHKADIPLWLVVSRINTVTYLYFVSEVLDGILIESTNIPNTYFWLLVVTYCQIYHWISTSLFRISFDIKALNKMSFIVNKFIKLDKDHLETFGQCNVVWKITYHCIRTYIGQTIRPLGTYMEKI